MKIALINENSQAAKNAMICDTLKKVTEPMGHEVYNYWLSLIYPISPKSGNWSIFSSARGRTSTIKTQPGKRPSCCAAVTCCWGTIPLTA